MGDIQRWLRWSGLVLVMIAARGQRLSAEDVVLRTRAEQMLEHARAATVVKSGVGVKTEASFQATADDGSLKSGTYVRLRGLRTGGLRQDLRYGDWEASSVSVGNERGRVGAWEFPPYGARRLMALVPFTVGSLDGQDVVREIREGGVDGQAATCIEFDTIRGEERNANEICLSKANGTILEIHEGERTSRFSKYAGVGGALYPEHVDYMEGTSFRLSADVVMTALDTIPDDAFAMPAAAKVGTLCRTATRPMGRSVPQPAAKGPEGAAVVEVRVRAYVTETGAVIEPHIVQAGRADLDAEALHVVSGWGFDPATCNGQKNRVPVDLVVRFQGW